MPNQRLGRECFAAYKREWRARKKKGAGNGKHSAGNRERVGNVKRRVSTKKEAESDTGNTEPAPYVPFIDGTPSQTEPWYDTFLRDLALRGSVTLAAAAAQVHRATAYRHMDKCPALAQETEAAQAYYREWLEWESVDLGRRKGNPLPYFARLKAELPARYIERQAVFHTQEVPVTPDEWRELLGAVTQSLSPAARARLVLIAGTSDSIDAVNGERA